MNDPERSELEQLRRMHSLMQAELQALGKRLEVLEGRKRAEETLIARARMTPVGVPPIIGAEAPTSQVPSAMAATPSLQDPQPRPEPVRTNPAAATPLTRPAQAASSIPLQPQTAATLPVVPPASATPPARGNGSFEMRLGTYWLVRVGVVMLLTGLVFFGNLAYQNFISKLGPAGKVSLLYLASFSMLVLGGWWQRKAGKDNLRNYAQVLFAGGLAAGYFTTYAAHHVRNLQIIGDPLLDGILLLLWAGAMAWIADRKKSEVLAVFAIGLAYYTSIMTRVGTFTLLSNTILTAAAVFFLVRNRWAALSYASVAATYASYAFWRFFDGTAWRWASPEEGLWLGTWFLICYWALFTIAVFLSRSEKLAGHSRATFLTLNNGAFFAMFLLTMAQSRQGGLWSFFLMYGAVLIAVSEAVRSFLPEERLARQAYLVQGLVLFTAGLIAKFSGVQLALMLAAESVVLLTLGLGASFASLAGRSSEGESGLASESGAGVVSQAYQRGAGWILCAGSVATAAMAVSSASIGLERFDTGTLAMGIGVGVLVLANAVLAHRRDSRLPGNPASGMTATLRALPLYFSIAAVLMWVITTYQNSSAMMFPLLLLVEGVLLTLSIYLVRMPELLLCGQLLLVAGSSAWLIRTGEVGGAPWWSFAIITGVNVAVGHWWRSQRVVALASSPVPADAAVRLPTLNRSFMLVMTGIAAAAFIAAIYAWVPRQISRDVWILLAAALGLGVTIYGLVTRAWMLAGFGQLLVLGGIVNFVGALWEGRPSWYWTVGPVLVLAVLGRGAQMWFEGRQGAAQHVREPILGLAEVYLWSAVVASIWYICEYTAPAHRAWVLVVVGAAVFALAVRRSRSDILQFAAAYTIVGLMLLWVPQFGTRMVSWLNLCALLVLLAQQRVVRAAANRVLVTSEAHTVLILAVAVSSWLFVSRWVLEFQGGFYLTVSWSVLALALFVMGMSFRERVYRWAGLGVLGFALGRVILFDVWKLGTVNRMLSFLALGVVLLVLGFVYNRYQERIRQWL